MAKCPECDGFVEKRTFRSPADYKDFVRKLIQAVHEGKLLLVRADCPLEDMLNPEWPMGDVASHDLQCAGCRVLFELCVNVWNGRNWWEPAGGHGPGDTLLT